MTKNSTVDIIERLLKIYSVKTMKELSIAMGFSSGVVANWKARDTIPFEVLLKIQKEKEVSWDWLIDGKEEQGRKLDALEELALMAFNALDDKGKINALSLMNGNANLNNSAISQNAGDNSVNNVFSGDNMTVNS